MLRTLVRNIVANWVGFAVQVAVTFFLTPFILHTLGDARYGAWALLMGLTGYYGLLDLGFRAGLTQFLARYVALKDFDKLNRTASTGFMSLGVISIVLALVTLVLAYVAPLIFNFPPGSVSEVRWAIFVVGMGVAVQFPFFAFSAVLPATQRYDISNAIGIATRVITAAGTVILLKAGYGLIGISVATMTGNLVDYGLRWRLAYRVLPQLHLSPRLANLRSFWEFTNFGLWNVLINGSRRILLYSGTIVIGLFLPAAAIAPYAVAASVVGYFHRLAVPFAQVFFPAATQLDASGKIESLREMYLAATRVLLSLGVVAGLIGVFWAHDFFRLWIGQEYVQGSHFGSVPVLFWIMMLGAVLGTAQRVGWNVLLGVRLHKVLAVLILCEAVATLGASVALVLPMGLYGVAVAGAICATMGAIAHPIVLCRYLRVTASTYFRSVCLRPIVLAVTLAASLTLLKSLVPPARGWVSMLLQGAVAGVLAVAMAILVVLTNGERQRFLLRPFQKAFASAPFERALRVRTRTEILTDAEEVV